MKCLKLQHVNQLEWNVSLPRNHHWCRNLFLSHFYVDNIRVTNLKSFENYIFVSIETIQNHHIVYVYQSQKELIHKITIEFLCDFSVHRTSPAQEEVLITGVQYHICRLTDTSCAKAVLSICIANKYLCTPTEWIIVHQSTIYALDNA